MNFCNVRNSSGGSTEQMENQPPLMPSPVILLQIFTVEVFFSVCLGKLLWLVKREGEAGFLLISDTYRYINQQYLSGLSINPKLQTVQGITVTTKTFASRNETTWTKSLHRWETVSTTRPPKRKESSDVLEWG